MLADTTEIYREGEGWELRMHVFQPREAKPCGTGMVFFFGGGWTNGTPEQFFPQAAHFASLGVVAACAEYRIASRHGTSPFESVEDAKAAVRWMRENAGRFGVEENRIVAAGGSAGGHLAACTALVEGFEKSGTSSRPDALVLFNPVVDTTERGFGTEKVTKERKTEISPCHHVRSGLPPMLILHGEADAVVPCENAERFAGEMRGLGNDCRLITYPGRGHGFFNRRERDGIVEDGDYRETLGEAERFLRELGLLERKGSS